MAEFRDLYREGYEADPEGFTRRSMALHDHVHRQAVRRKTLPRIDRLAAAPDGHSEFLRGTPTAGASFDNRWGIAPLPAGWKDLDTLVLVQVEPKS